MTNHALAVGSLAAVANRDGLTLAEAFLNCDVIAVIDQSGSMAAKDAPGGRSRYAAAAAELATLQRRHPGQVAVIEFAEFVRFCPGGVPCGEGMNTDMAAALHFVHVADGASQIILISDGRPDDEHATLAAARRFRWPIHTIYIGPEDGDGADFLAQLADATGGRSYVSDAPGLLADSVARLLLTA